jgi:L-lactate dehydrogenase complex protein LldG
MVSRKYQEGRNSREAILAAVRSTVLPACDLPSLEADWITYPDPLDRFSTVLQSVGAQCFHLPNAFSAHDKLLQLQAYRDAKQLISCVPDVGDSTFDLSSVTDPHQLEPLDLAILPAEFGVAENGAIWLSNRNLPSPVLPFIVQHLILVLATRELVHNMHQAYARLQFQGPQYGTFIAGPSKTADIEQSLVIGAHGPRSLTVLCIV